ELRGAERRHAAISSFGFSGTNAHLVIGEYVPSGEGRTAEMVIPSDTKAIIALSARRPEQLQQRVRDLRNYIRQEGASVNLLELAYTLQVGREAMEERLGFVVNSVAELAEKLDAYTAGQPGIKDFYPGQVKHGKESISLISQDDEVRQ